MTDLRSPITTHVLDTAIGRPAAGVPVTLCRADDPSWQQIGAGITNADGRVTDLLQPGSLRAGVYKIRFDTGVYFQRSGTAAFYPWAEIVFTVDDPGGHYHVPLLLNPFGYSTYRGS
jgi:5-hydroxyisourate hydrolase